MAPAPTTAAREPDAFDEAEPSDPDPHRRRALASVDNVPPMEEDDMGLQNPSLAKDQDMEQILVELGSSELAQADLLQAIKTLEGGGDSLSTGETDSIFPLAGFDLPDTMIDSEGDTADDKIATMQTRLERRCAFLERRLRILQARTIGKRISEEAAQTFEKCSRGARKDGTGRACGLKALLKRIETTSALQASAASRSVVGPKYFHAGTSKGDASRSASIGIPSGTLAGLEDTAGALRSHLSVVKHELDSDATLSSSGAESNDEAIVYNNPHQQPMPVEKRALWSWQRARASIASRWCWLQAQVQELEYKIRQHTDLHRQVRAAKGPVELADPVGYSGPLPGGAVPAPSEEGCARARPLRRDNFKRRKLLQMHNLHTATAKAAKPADIRCSCQYPEAGCAVCTGRAVSTEPLPPPSTLPPALRLALLDPGYHPVLSDIRDVSPGVHLAALSSRGWFRSRVSAWRGARHAPPHAPAAPPRHHRHKHLHPHREHKPLKPRRLKRGRPPLSRKVRERDRDDDHDRHRARASTESRQSRVTSSYDIDNIVIPQSVAANTRPEILHYKEILTPKWRVLEVDAPPLNNGVDKHDAPPHQPPHTDLHILSDSEEEDISDVAVSARHQRSEVRERSKYIRKQRSRRSTHALSADAPPPLPAPAPPPLPPPPPPHPHQHETVRPYSPRRFPLPDVTYTDMLASMPVGHRAEPSAPERHPSAAERGTSAPESRSPSEEPESSLSPMSPLVYEGDDPDDAEWEPRERPDRRYR